MLTLPCMNPRISITLLLIALLPWSGHLLETGVVKTADEHTVATGTWGGEHIVLNVAKTGTEVEFDCAHGRITQAITLDKHGNFDVAGTLTREHGGPVLRDETPVASSARYSGHVDGDTLSLTVTLTKEKQEVGTYTLTRGAQPMLTKCR